jgi:uncharacterized protein (TIGR02996 family)
VTSRAASTPARNAELEAAIVAAPDDPEPRMVYGDWLQAQGDPRGEWAALMAGVEAAPADTRLRSAAVAFLGARRRDVLGAGAAAMSGAYIGWRGGFIDELRLQPIGRVLAKDVAALLRHPTCRFVRHVALGRMIHIVTVLDELVAAAPPLLEELVVIDDTSGGPTITVDAIAELPLRRLTLACATISRPMPTVVELVANWDVRELGWLRAANFPALEELCVIARSSWRGTNDFDALLQLVRDLPALRRLRVIGEQRLDALVEGLARISHRIELVDVSHCDVDASMLARLRAWDRPPQVVALGTSPRTAWNAIDADDEAWLTHRLATEGRDAIRRIPGAGVVLYNLGTNLLTANETDPRAIPILDVAATLPVSLVGTYPLANAAIAHEKAMQLDEAELRAREALLLAPREPNFHAILVDALRRTGRLAEAESALPAALKAIANAPKAGHRGAIGACLLDCMLVLAQVGRYKDVLALAKQHAKHVTAECQCVVAMANVALGKLAAAKTAMTQTKQVNHPVLHHARAVMYVAAGKKKDARAELAKLRATKYTELGWLDRDPNLAALSATAASVPVASRRAPRRARRR